MNEAIGSGRAKEKGGFAVIFVGCCRYTFAIRKNTEALDMIVYDDHEGRRKRRRSKTHKKNDCHFRMRPCV